MYHSNIQKSANVTCKGMCHWQTTARNMATYNFNKINSCRLLIIVKALASKDQHSQISPPPYGTIQMSNSARGVATSLNSFMITPCNLIG